VPLVFEVFLCNIPQSSNQHLPTLLCYSCVVSAADVRGSWDPIMLLSMRSSRDVMWNEYFIPWGKCTGSQHTFCSSCCLLEDISSCAFKSRASHHPK
jgi:hypothetical protein